MKTLGPKEVIHPGSHSWRTVGTAIFTSSLGGVGGSGAQRLALEFVDLFCSELCDLEQITEIILFQFLIKWALGKTN